MASHIPNKEHAQRDIAMNVNPKGKVDHEQVPTGEHHVGHEVHHHTGKMPHHPGTCGGDCKGPHNG